MNLHETCRESGKGKRPALLVLVSGRELAKPAGWADLVGEGGLACQGCIRPVAPRFAEGSESHGKTSAGLEVRLSAAKNQDFLITYTIRDAQTHRK